MKSKTSQHHKRLTEIATTALGDLSDEQVLELLAERKHLAELQAQYEIVQQKQNALQVAEQELAAEAQELGAVNSLIVPEKADDELIHLVEERKKIEEKQAATREKIAKLTAETSETPTLPGKTEADMPEILVAQEKEVSEETGVQAAKEEIVAISEPAIPTGAVVEKKEEVVQEDFGEERITPHELSVRPTLAPYLEQIKNRIGSIGKILENLPASARKDKAFMLGVAAVDPAYAMHYADEALKKDEDFNLHVASIERVPHSGNVLAEMLPEMRTARVIEAAIKQDYRNIRYASTSMPDYENMLERAKRLALKKVKELHQGIDVMTLLPKVLQQDKLFMKQVEEVTAQSQEVS